jgi:hypothetical protein
MYFHDTCLVLFVVCKIYIFFFVMINTRFYHRSIYWVLNCNLICFLLMLFYNLVTLRNYFNGFVGLCLEIVIKIPQVL